MFPFPVNWPTEVHALRKAGFLCSHFPAKQYKQFKPRTGSLSEHLTRSKEDEITRVSKNWRVNTGSENNRGLVSENCQTAARTGIQTLTAWRFGLYLHSSW